MKVEKLLYKIIPIYENILNEFEEIDNDKPIELYIIEKFILNPVVLKELIISGKWSDHNGIYSVYPSDSIDRRKIYKYSYVIYNNNTEEFLNKYFFTPNFYYHSLQLSGINE